MSIELIVGLCIAAFIVAVDPINRAVIRHKRRKQQARAEAFYRGRDSTAD